MGKIEDFVKIGSGYGSDYGYGYGYGYGSDYGYGYGYGYGSGYGSDDGSGSGSGDGSGSGYGYGSGSGYGYGYGDGSGSGSGYGSGYGDRIKSINGNNVYRIDGLPTIFVSVRNNIAKGFILQTDLSLTPCYIVKENNKFAHGNTLREAFEALQEKLYDDSTEEERIERFKEHFVDFSKKYTANELFIWHHILTGSCKIGRESFCKNKGINIEKDAFTIYEFIELTKNEYNGNIIKKLLN